MAQSTATFEAIKLQVRTATFRQGLFLLIGLLAMLITLTLIAEQYHLDLRLSADFYTPGKGWTLSHAQPWYALYKYGTLPGLLLSAGALIGFFLSCTRSRWQGLQRHFLLVVLAVVIGPGLIVNSFCKDYWGRPRPEQTINFGGQWEYRPVFSPGTPGRGRSFPCGHCTMGYCFLTLVVFWKRSRRMAWAGGLVGLFYGSLVGWARIVAGAHFATDVLWSLGIVAMVITVLYYWVLRIPDFHDAPVQARVLSHQGWLALKLTLFALLILLAFLSRRPYFDTYKQPIKLGEHTNHIVVHANVNFKETSVRYLSGAQPRIVIQDQGYAFPISRHAIHSWERDSGRTVHLYQEVIRKGYHAESNYRCEIILPQNFKNKIEIDLHAPL
jgi:lipid A 4'-phosphatase